MNWFVDIGEQQEFAKILMYGREGSTKTTSAASAANLGQTLMINAEAGSKKAPLERWGVDTGQLKMWPPRGSIDVASLRKVCDNLKSDLMKDPDTWFAVILDSLSDLADVVLAEATAKRVLKEQRRGMEPDPDFVDRSDYGMMTKQMRDIARRFRDLPCHVILTALERKAEDDNTSPPTISYGPSVTPALATDVMGYMDVVMYYRAPDEDGPARALVRGKKIYRTKDRYGTLPDVLAEPTFPRILGYINGDLTEETDPVQESLPKKKNKTTTAAN